jgi:hypothetical protein
MEVNGQLHAPASLPPRNPPPPERRLVGTHSRPGRDGEENISLPSSYRESNPGHPARSLVTILTKQPATARICTDVSLQVRWSRNEKVSFYVELYTRKKTFCLSCVSRHPFCVTFRESNNARAYICQNKKHSSNWQPCLLTRVITGSSWTQGNKPETPFNFRYVRPQTRRCIQKLPDWPPGATTANGTALCH